MPIINATSQRETLSQFVPYEPEQHQEYGFGEVFGASLGFVIDEELSISSALNREGWRDRQARVNDLIRNEEIPNPDRYRTKGGRMRSIDYNRIARDLNREDIKTDEQLNSERNETLKSRRDYYQQVTQNGSGTAQFLGALNAYMLDPVNILTVGIAAPATTARSIGTLGRIARATKNAALIEGAAEIGIQGLVYQHKQDIDSPYSARDAIANIAMAATGAGILGGATEGIAGWLRAVSRQGEQLPQTADVAKALEYIRRQEQTLALAPKLDVPQAKARLLLPGKTADQELAELKQSILDEANAELTDLAQYRINRGDSKILRREQKAFTEEIEALQAPTPQQIKAKVQELKGIDPRQPARARKKQAAAILKEQYDIELKKLQDAKKLIDLKLQRSELALNAKGDLTRIQQGIIPERYQQRIDQKLHEKQVQMDVLYLEEMARREVQYAPPSKEQAIYEPPPAAVAPRVQPRAPRVSMSELERRIATSQGLDDVIAKEMAEFDALEYKVLIIDDEAVDAQAILKQYDDEIEGLDSVLSCTITGAV